MNDERTDAGPRPMPDMPMPTDPPATTTTMAMPTTTVQATTTTTKATTTTTTAPAPPAPVTGNGVSVDRVVKSNSGPSSVLVSPGLSTSGPNELLVAFLSSDGPGQASSQSFTKVTRRQPELVPCRAQQRARRCGGDLDGVGRPAEGQASP